MSGLSRAPPSFPSRDLSWVFTVSFSPSFSFTPFLPACCSVCPAGGWVPFRPAIRQRNLIDKISSFPWINTLFLIFMSSRFFQVNCLRMLYIMSFLLDITSTKKRYFHTNTFPFCPPIFSIYFFYFYLYFHFTIPYFLS